MAINADVLDSFFVALGFKVDTGGLENFQKKMGELRAAALSLGTAVAGPAVAIGQMVQKAAGSMGELQRFAELNHLSAKEVAALNEAGADNLVSNQAMEASIQSLNVKTGDALKGIGTGRTIFEKFGLTAKDVSGKTKSFTQILGDVAEKMKGMSAQERLSMANQLGLDPKLIPLLEKGKANLEEETGKAKSAHPLSNEDYERASSVERLFDKASKAAEELTSQIAAALMPTVKKILEKFLAWFEAIRSNPSDVFVKALKTMASTVDQLWDRISSLVDAGAAALEWMSQFEAATWLAEGAVAALVAYKVGTWAKEAGEAAVVLTKAVLGLDGAAAGMNATLLGGSLMVIALIVNDLWKWYEGNDSVIGQFLTKYPEAIRVLEGLGLVLGAIFLRMKWSVLGPMSDSAEGVAKFAKKWIATQYEMASSAARAAATASANWVRSAYQAAAEWIGSMSMSAAATWSALAPILLMVAAVGLVIAAVYLLYKNWTDIHNYIAGTWEELKEKVHEYVEAIESAWRRIKGLLGLGATSTVTVKDAKEEGTPRAAKKTIAPLSSHIQTLIRQGTVPSPTPTMPSAQARPIGIASSHRMQSTTVHNTISGNTITVVSPDPAKAGEAVMERLELQPSHTRTMVRNSQSQVGL